VRFERSYDRCHANAARIYRVPLDFAYNYSADDAGATNYGGVGPSMKADFPEVADFGRVARSTFFGGTTMFTYTDERGETKRFNESDFFFADPGFLRMFSFPFLKGDPNTALSGGNSVVISASIARKYFGNEDPMGKTMYLNRDPLVVKGVFTDIPDNSHIHFQML
jgi:putative ABC transport system permease protein